MKRTIHPVLAGAFVLLLGPLAAVGRADTTVSEPFAGVKHIHRTFTEPRPLNVHIVLVDLQHPGVRVKVTPSNGEDPGESTAQTTREYLQAVGAQIAINASFFYINRDAGVPYPHLDNRGVIASEGDVYSPFEPDGRPWPVFNIARDHTVQIFERNPDAGAADADNSSTRLDGVPQDRLYNAVSGSERILRDGENVAATQSFGQPNQLHPRTAIGVTADGDLMLVTVDGRQPGVSEGVTTPELAHLMLEHGATDAVNLDGGGSTTLVFDQGDGARVINVPVGVGGEAGSERRNAASLAIFAPPAPADEGGAAQP